MIPTSRARTGTSGFPGLGGDRFTGWELHPHHMLSAEKVTMVGRMVGRPLDKIRELGLWDNTLIMPVSDQGKPHGNGEQSHGLMRMFLPRAYGLFPKKLDIQFELCLIIEDEQARHMR